MDKDIHHDGKIPAHEDKIDGLFDSNLKSSEPKENSVLLLLPLSGGNASIGKNVLNACLLASDNAQNIDFHLIDTADISREKYVRHSSLNNKNLKAIIGPIFSNETAQYGALYPNVPILSLSNNLKINNGHVFACGLSLHDEISALFAFANSQYINTFLVMLPDGEFGDQILDIIISELKNYGLEKGEDLEIIRYTSISRKAATKYAINSNKKAVFVINPILAISELENMDVFTLSSVALANSEVWNGAIFAFSDNLEQQKFVKKYYSAFRKQPTVLDMVGYDLMKIVKEFINSGDQILQNNYRGCLGEFSIDKKNILRRKLQIFRLTNSGKTAVVNKSLL